MRSCEKCHCPRDISIWSSAGWERKDVNSSVFGQQWEEMKPYTQNNWKSSEDICCLLSSQCCSYDCTRLGLYEGTKGLFAKMIIFWQLLPPEGSRGHLSLLQKTGWFTTESRGKLCLSDSDAVVLVGHTSTFQLFLRASGCSDLS